MQSKKESVIDPDAVRKAIYLIDSYRAHLFYDIAWIDKKVAEGKLGKRFKISWKNLRKTMIKMASISSEIAGVRKLAKIQNYLEALWQICVPLVVIAVFLSLFVPQNLSFVKGMTIYLLAIAFSSMILGLIGRFVVGGKIGRKIEGHFLRNPDAHKFKNYEIRASVQLLIEELRIHIRESNQNPHKHLIGLNFLDYKNIRVSKKPRPWRKYYLAEVIP